MSLINKVITIVNKFEDEFFHRDDITEKFDVSFIRKLEYVVVNLELTKNPTFKLNFYKYFIFAYGLFDDKIEDIFNIEWISAAESINSYENSYCEEMMFLLNEYGKFRPRFADVIDKWHMVDFESKDEPEAVKIYNEFNYDIRVALNYC